jgi:tripartite-type tricarboxylate transporter receptor subunit TctC
MPTPRPGPNSPGSPDIVGRIVAEALAKMLGQPVVVMKRTGAGGTIAAAATARAAPDGYTVLQANANHSFSQTLAHPKVGVRPVEDRLV